MTDPLWHIDMEPRVLALDIRKRDAAYIAAGRWRCESNPHGKAHESIYIAAESAFICRWCKSRR